MGSLEEGDKLAAQGATAPRVTLESMQDRVVGEFYLNGADLVRPIMSDSENHSMGMQHCHKSLSALTICVLVLDNGFTLVGKSAPASIENFDNEKGCTFAKEDALRQLWPLEGYLLRNRLAGH